MINDKIDITISKQTANNISKILKEIGTEEATVALDCLYYAILERESDINTECARLCPKSNSSEREREEWTKLKEFYRNASENARKEQDKAENMLDRIIRKEQRA